LGRQQLYIGEDNVQLQLILKTTIFHFSCLQGDRLLTDVIECTQAVEQYQRTAYILIARGKLAFDVLVGRRVYPSALAERMPEIGVEAGQLVLPCLAVVDCRFLNKQPTLPGIDVLLER